MNIDGYALVTGAGSGIGLACAQMYAKEGAAGVAFADINKPAAEKAAAESIEHAKHPNFRTLVIEVDITDEESVERMVEQTIQEFGRLDYAVNSAAIPTGERTEIADLTFPVFDRVVQVNINGMFHCVRAEVRAMKKQEPLSLYKDNPTRGSSRGVIVNMASVVGLAPSLTASAYGTSKYAVVGLTKNAAVDSAKYNIRINCVCPSNITTPMFDTAVSLEQKKLFEEMTPMKRLGHPDEVADIIMYLSSPRSSYVTGSSWAVTGGFGGH